MVVGGAISSDPNRSTTGAGAGGAGVGLEACVRDSSGCVRDTGAGAGAEEVGVGRVGVSTGGYPLISPAHSNQYHVKLD